MNVFNAQDELTDSYTNEDFIIARLFGLLFNKTVAGSKHVKRIEYPYNYSNKQEVTFVLDNEYKLVFIDIPTSGGLLDEAGIMEILNNKEVK